MIFDKVFLEKSQIENPYALNILKKLKVEEPILIDKYSEIFGKYKKPYLHKRTNLNLFLARKEGKLLKKAPDAYGQAGAPHYYFIHAYNCIYECTYCYLQGHFNSPDLVFFVNHDEIIGDIESKILEHQSTSNDDIWFHAGEFSDSLALSHITGELDNYFELFKKYPNALLELRTKSVNIKELLKLTPLPNVITSFSIGTDFQVKSHDLKTPPLTSRLKTIKKLKDMGHPIGLHFDPIIIRNDLVRDFELAAKMLIEYIDPSDVEYISLGVVRFPKDVYHQVKNNYPDSEYFHSELTKGQDGKIKYPAPMRKWALGKIKEVLISFGFIEKQIYLCME